MGYLMTASMREDSACHPRGANEKRNETMKKSHANNRTPLLAGLWALALIGVLALPQTANAQGGPLSTIDQKVGDIQDEL